MHQLVCSEPITFSTVGVPECGSTEGFVSQELPAHIAPVPFQFSDLDPVQMGLFFVAGFIIYFSWWVVSKPLVLAINTATDFIRRLNGDFH